MRIAGRRIELGRVLAIVALAAIAGVVAALTLDIDRDGVGRASAAQRPATDAHAGGACRTAGTAALAAVDEAAALRIYADELRGLETRADVAHITESTALLSAIAGSDRAAIQRAVHALVYAPRWHIVRLRVLQGGRVASDIGGPYIIAPVSGSLRWHGSTVGSYVMSVQDDAGFVKLVTRFIGVPIGIYRNGSYLMGTLAQPPRAVSNGATVALAGSSYREQVFTARAFPTGTLQVALFVKPSAPAAAARSCAAVRSVAWGAVAAHIAARFKPLQAHYRDLVGVVRSVTGGLAFVRSGSQRIAGGPGPSTLPPSGSVTYRGRRWTVYSFAPVPPARVYLLMPR